MITHKPSSLSYVESASIPVVAVTAWQGLFDRARLETGQTVVIHGAAGNVGAYAVQLACDAGLRTIATAAGEDLPFLRDLGADTVVDFQTERFEDVAGNVDAVLDLVGGETQLRSFDVLRRGGKLISAVSQPDQQVARSHGVEAAFFLVDVSSRSLTEIADRIDGGRLRTRVGAVLPLAQARDAHLLLEGRHPSPKGKIVLTVESP
jgi:NADPH:quinone reductase-like Zn-dependent oxidoreductase